MVDHDSDLYYDPTPLREYEKEAQQSPDTDRADRGSMPPPSHPSVMDSPQLRRPHMSHGPHTPQQQHSVPFSPRHPSQFQGASPFSHSMPVTPTQFYGNGEPGIRMGGMGGMGMHMDGMAAMGGMQGMGMPMGMGSPGMARLRRGPMGMEDQFSGMH